MVWMVARPLGGMGARFKSNKLLRKCQILSDGMEHGLN